MEDKEAFAGHEDNNERTRLYTITRFELLKQLIQAAIGITDRNDLKETSIVLLSKIQSIVACEHPDAVGGPYGLLERLMFDDNLVDRNQKESCIKLKSLLKFNQIRHQYPSNNRFIQKLFTVLHHHTDSSITPHFLQLIKDRPIKIWFLNSIQKPRRFQYSTDLHGNTRIISSLQLVTEKSAQPSQEPARQETYQATQTLDEWLAYIEGPTKKKFTGHIPKTTTQKKKQQHSSLAATTPSSQRKRKQNPKPLQLPLQRTQGLSYTKLQEKSTKKQTQKPKKPALLSALPISSYSLEDSMIPRSSRPVKDKLTTDIPLRPIPAIIGQGLSLLPTIEEEEVIKEKEDADHPAVFPTTIPPTPTTKATSNNTPLTPSHIEKVPMMDHLMPTVEGSSLLPTKQSLSSSPTSTPSKPAKKKAPIKFIITEKPARTTAQAISPSKEKVQQEAEENIQKKEPSKKVAPAASLDDSLLIYQPIFTQNTTQAISQRHFIMPKGLRSFHAQQLQAAHPIIPYPKHLPTINQLFDPTTQEDITYKVFATLWAANGGDIKQKGGSHFTLQFPQGTNLFGIYKPHGSSATYGKQAIRYLQAATLYIGLRPTNWS
jgi:hypothetical protein